MQIHTLTRRTGNKAATRVGRGGKRGKTSGRGHKGQKARAGGTPRPAIRDTIKKLPKLRGHGKNRSRTVNSGTSIPAPVNLSALDKVFSSGETVTLALLRERGVIPRKAKSAKLLGTGELSKKLNFEGFEMSATARQKIEAAGGTVK